MDYDVFISHASEEKERIVRPLAEMLKHKGYNVWYDEFTLTVGDSLRKSIDKGLRSSRFGIVVLSKAFFGKNWPAYELDGLNSREQLTGSKVILPLWHDVSVDFIAAHSLTLADRVAVSTSLSLPAVVRQLQRALGTPGGEESVLPPEATVIGPDVCDDCGQELTLKEFTHPQRERDEIFYLVCENCEQNNRGGY